MHYEVNVSENGQHVFATHERSLMNLDEIFTLALRLHKAFPKRDISVRRKEATITEMGMFGNVERINKAISQLDHEYRDWCREYNVPDISTVDLLESDYFKKMSPTHQRWLRDFLTRYIAWETFRREN